MSRAFVKELDEQDEKGGPIRPQSPHVNYVTPRGMTLLQDKISGLATALDDLRGRCQVPCDNNPLRSYPLFQARSLLLEVFGTPLISPKPV